MKLRVTALGLAVGTMWGLVIFVATLWTAIAGRGMTLAKLGGYYVGYTVSFGGAVVGLLWGVVSGFILGALLAWLYNTFQQAIYKSGAGGA